VSGMDTRQRADCRLTVASTAALAREIYADVPGTIGHKQSLRPYICPFHVIADFVPRGARILDVGCGAGLFIALLARLGKIDSAVGFDADGSAILAAQRVTAKFPNASVLKFERRTTHDSWPEGHFDVVSLIDVIHHIKPEKQAEVIATAAQHVTEGGLLLYKDMASRPLWRAWANRLHDLLSVREWIYYAAIDDVISWARAAGLHPEARGMLDMLWYRHEWCVLRRPSST
jgi:2-polyprenyl-3-methyl-5-hydroxy-6-metoxy-1,4-benzoquinol methylase